MMAPSNSGQPPLASVATTTASTAAIVGVRLACQAVVLVLTARLLGVDNFGIMAALVSVSLVLGPWSGLGFDFVALRAVARDRTASSDCFWQGTRLVGMSALPLITVSIAIALLVLGERFRPDVLALVLVAELLFLRVTELIAKILQGNDLYHSMAIVRLMNSLFRLVVLVPLAVIYAELTLLQWGWAYLFAALLSLGFGVGYLKLRVGLTGPGQGGGSQAIGDGLHFAAGITSMRLSSEFDKALVLGLAGAAGAGVYAAAFRLVNLAVAPVISFVNVVITSLFKLHGDDERSRLSQRALGLSGVALAYGAVVGGLIWLFLPDIAALVLGEDFRAVSAALLPLALLPVSISGRLVAEQAMAALGEFGIRTAMQWSVATFAVIANLLSIPRVGWAAAAWVLLIVETVLALGYVAVIFRAGRATGQGGP